VDPGLYSETTLLWTTYWTMTAGGRVDFAHTTAKSPTAEYPQTLGTALDQGDMLYAGYLTNALDLSSNWTTHVGVGYSEITPDLFQRYANGVLLGVIQSGFSRIFGKPSLPKERLLQVDWDVEAKFDRLRGRAGVFYGWLYDYATYEANVITEPSGARLLYATSTDRAALHGFELYGEYDVCPRVTPFGSMRYVRGEDCVISQPLPQIPPLEATVGLRLEDTEAVRPWGLEYGVRMVAGQDRIAFLRRRVITGVEPLEYPTSGFTTAYVRGYITPTPNLHIIGGIDNLFDRSYVEHLNLRLAPQGPNVATPVLSPGITPYLAVEWRL
jgi:iron complex outermembrane receptor protein